MSNIDPAPHMYGFGTPVEVVDCADDDNWPTGGCLTDNEAPPMSAAHATHVLDHEDEYAAATVARAYEQLNDTPHELGVVLPPIDERPHLGVSAAFADDQRVDEGEIQDAIDWYALTQEISP